MALLPILTVVLLLLLGFLGVRRLLGTSSPAAVDRSLSWRWAGLLIGVAGAVAAIRIGTLGRGELLAAPIFGLGALTGVLLGELNAPVPDGPTRRAQMRVRRATDYIRPVLGLIVIAATAALALLASVTTAYASADDQGRAGRQLACASGAAHGPWPGSFYTIPGGVLVLAGLALAGLSLRRIVRRPQPADTAAGDDQVRRRSAEAVTSAGGILVLVPLMGVAVTAGAGLIAEAGNCGHGWWTSAGWGLVALGGVAFVTAVWFLAQLLIPARPRVTA